MMDSPAAAWDMRKSGHWSVGARSETGYVRKSNEDRMDWVRAPFGEVFLIADGMGGYSGGAKAARITVDTLKDHLSSAAPQQGNFAQQVADAFQAANHEVHTQRRNDDPDTREMGATGLAVITGGGRFCVAHVGDSRAYRWRPGMPLQRLTRDHSHVQSLVDAGVLTEAEAAQHPDASVLERAIGHRDSVQAEVSPWIPLRHGDRILMCTDGLSGFVSDAEIEAILRSNKSAQRATDRLVECALSKGGEDNVTVQLARYSLPLSRRVGWWWWLSVTAVLVLAGLVFHFDPLHWRQPKPQPSGGASGAASAPASAAASSAPAAPADPPASAPPATEPGNGASGANWADALRVEKKPAAAPTARPSAPNPGAKASERKADNKKAKVVVKSGPKGPGGGEDKLNGCTNPDPYRFCDTPTK